MDIILLLATFCAYFVKGLAGFANTLVFSSILAFHMESKTISPTDLVLSFPANIYIVWKERKSISIKVVITLSLLVILGLIPGAFLLKTGDQQQLKIVLGSTIVLLGLEMLLRLRKPNKMKYHPVLSTIICILSGVICGLFGIGAFLAAYISRTTENQSQFRGNISCVFLVENVVRFILYSITGVLTIGLLKSSIIMFPVVAIGLLTGVAVSKRMEENTVKIIISALLTISGILLVLKNI